MTYYFSKTLLQGPCEEVMVKVTEGLEREGFGVLTEIHVKDTLKEKLDVDSRKYGMPGESKRVTDNL